jgi:DNA primase
LFLRKVSSIFARMMLLVNILESFLGDYRKHNEDTGQIAFDCPACSFEKNKVNGDGKGNLEVNYNRGIFRCWSCQDTNNMHGPIIKLLKKYATKKNIRDYILLRPEDFKPAEKVKQQVELKLPESYKLLAYSTSKDYKYNQAIKYLRDRGITDEIISEYDIGYTTHGKFFNRIIIPSYDAEGKLNYFIARWFDAEYTKLKYLNPEVEKQLITFNEYKINWDATLYLVEGATDHIVIPNSIPLLGKYITPELIEKIHDKAMGLVIIVLDDDAKDDAIRLYKQLNFGNLMGRLRLVVPPAGYDPSKIFQALGAGGVVKLLRSARRILREELY